MEISASFRKDQKNAPLIEITPLKQRGPSTPPTGLAPLPRRPPPIDRYAPRAMMPAGGWMAGIRWTRVIMIVLVLSIAYLWYRRNESDRVIREAQKAAAAHGDKRLPAFLKAASATDTHGNSLTAPAPRSVPESAPAPGRDGRSSDFVFAWSGVASPEVGDELRLTDTKTLDMYSCDPKRFAAAPIRVELPENSRFMATLSSVGGKRETCLADGVDGFTLGANPACSTAQEAKRSAVVAVPFDEACTLTGAVRKPAS